MAQDPYKYFRLEASELLDQFSKGILELEKGGGNAALIQRLLRLAHTLKGAARVVKQQEIAERAHAIEDALAASREPPHAVGQEQIGAILKLLDEIGPRIPPLEPAAGSVAQGDAKAVPEEGPRIVRTDVAEMDSVLDGIAEAHALLGGLRSATEAADQAQQLADVLLAQLAPRAAAEAGRQPLGGAERLFSLAEELRRKFGALERNLGSTVDQLDRELHQLRDVAEQLRLVPAETLFVPLERAARDSAQALAKQVTFEASGGEIRLDTRVLGTLQAALVQIVRNAVAHGIESGVERRAAGKPESGRVTVEISRRGRRILVRCRDDGRGLDLDAVRRLVVRRGLSGTAASGLGAEELIRLLLRGGISTAGAVTAVSGRGVGLDVVREAVERLGGEVTVRTEVRRGTTFELVVPPSLASMEALILEASGVAATIPLDAVRGAMRLAAEDIAAGPNGASVLHDGKAIPFMPLARPLAGGRPAAGGRWTAVVVRGTEGLAAIGVDRLRGTARAVVRPLPKHAVAGAIVAGASLDAEGNPQLVLDPDGLVAEARRAEDTAPAPAKAARPVLVIDDSLTTRMLEQSILESAGYEVDVALSGEEGLEKARQRRYALILVDVEMPGMDGFTFIERIRSDPALHDVPAILVTSRAAPDDLRRGSAVGAQGYVVKSEFDQSRLLAMIRPLAG